MNMPTANVIQKRRSPEFTGIYLRLLDGQPARPEDWEAAAELIEAGMATGRVHRSSATAAGESKRANSLIGRLQKWIWALGGAVGGVLATTFSDLQSEAMKRWLGW
ncbi:hypothetical protein [Comamonas aquatilis]|uniref:hypothetical protein n=1 Tax=Comamonas aquatilis TaxID=1778406 RepID=UPI0039F01BE9